MTMITTWPRDRHTGPGGGLYAGPGDGLYAGPCSNPYRNNWPPLPVQLERLARTNRHDVLRLLQKSLPRP